MEFSQSGKGMLGMQSHVVDQERAGSLQVWRSAEASHTKSDEAT